VTHDGTSTDAPEEDDVVTVVEQGDPDAPDVLVLVPGTSAGVGYFLPVGEDLVDAAPDWQIWSDDRREHLLEDHSVLNACRNGDAGTRETFDHYLGWIADDTIEAPFEPPVQPSNEAQYGYGLGVDASPDSLQLRAPVTRLARRGGSATRLGRRRAGAQLLAEPVRRRAGQSASGLRIDADQSTATSVGSSSSTRTINRPSGTSTPVWTARTSSPSATRVGTPSTSSSSSR